MIRSKPSTDVYRDGWDRVFAEAREEHANSTLADLIESECAAAHAAAEVKEHSVYTHGYGYRDTGHCAGCAKLSTVMQTANCDCPPEHAAEAAHAPSRERRHVRIVGIDADTPASWPTEHESDCPSLRGENCRCPMGNL